MGARFGAFEVDLERRQLLRNGSEIHLTPKAFDLLALLIGEAPRVVRKNELHDRLWPGTFVSDATLVGLIKEVRRGLDDRDSASPLIRTAHGVGYAFAAALERVVRKHGPGVSRWVVVGTRRIALADGENVIGRSDVVHPVDAAASPVVTRGFLSTTGVRSSRISRARTVRWSTTSPSLAN